MFLNADPKSDIEINLPDGEWDVLVDQNSAGINPLKTISENISVPPSSGIVLKKK